VKPARKQSRVQLQCTHSRFGRMAQCAVHALKGLADRAPVLLAHTEVSKI
jgi:hypothetical protein